MKRKIIVILSLLIMLFVMPKSYAIGNMRLTVTANNKNVKAGEEVTFTVNIHNASDIGKMQFTFNYDKDRLEYKDENYKDVLKGASFKQVKHIKEEGKLGLIASFNEALSVENGEVCSFVFIVKEGAPLGEIDYSITQMKIGPANENIVEHDYFERSNSVDVTVLGTCSVIKGDICGDMITVGVDLQNAEPKARLLIVIYDNNRFVGIKSVDVSGFSGVFNISVDVSRFYDRLTSVKTFIIDDYDSLCPLSNSIEINTIL